MGQRGNIETARKYRESTRKFKKEPEKKTEEEGMLPLVAMMPESCNGSQICRTSKQWWNLRSPHVQS